jgi:hypothetical protein
MSFAGSDYKIKKPVRIQVLLTPFRLAFRLAARADGEMVDLEAVFVGLLLENRWVLSLGWGSP